MPTIHTELQETKSEGRQAQPEKVEFRLGGKRTEGSGTEEMRGSGMSDGGNQVSEGLEAGKNTV